MNTHPISLGWVWTCWSPYWIWVIAWVIFFCLIRKKPSEANCTNRILIWTCFPNIFIWSYILAKNIRVRTPNDTKVNKIFKTQTNHPIQWKMIFRANRVDRILIWAHLPKYWKNSHFGQAWKVTNCTNWKTKASKLAPAILSQTSEGKTIFTHFFFQKQLRKNHMVKFGSRH